MLSPNALQEAATAVGMWPWDHVVERDGETVKEVHWHLPGDPYHVPLGHPFMVHTTAAWLRSQVVARAGNDALARYMETCRRLDPVVIRTGVVFISDDFVICAAMVALGFWSEEYARSALRSAWRSMDEKQEKKRRLAVQEQTESRAVQTGGERDL